MPVEVSRAVEASGAGLLAFRCTRQSRLVESLVAAAWGRCKGLQCLDVAFRLAVLATMNMMVDIR